MAEGLPVARPNPFDPPETLSGDTPLRRLSYPDGHLGWLVTGHGTARQVLADPRFSSRRERLRAPVERPLADTPEVTRPLDPGMFLTMDPPEHTRFRRALTGQFTVRRMNQLRPRIEAIVAERLDALEAEGPGSDLVSSFALPVPSLVICELLGVPYADRALFQRASATILRLDVTPAEAAGALWELLEYLRGLISGKRAGEVTDDLLSGLVEAGEFDDDELLGIAFLLLVAGHETTANMLSLGALTLLCHPEQALALRAGVVAADNAVEELLRYLSIVQFGLGRWACQDVELEGERITAGEAVTIALPAVNRSTERFADPDTLDLNRDARGHLAFGHGVHQCLGQQLARIEMRVGYLALLDRFPGLRLAVPVEDVPLRSDMTIYGVHELPVTW